ncbi:glycosyltransferase [Paenibacillus glycanilyticus]|uniref:tetratricopeptide repeat-containing glycosyltransferase family 2 protein n=1 Tax=Paenibacillus glycanilyticus TaxID=126569 RepID=UPI00203E9808|nr:TPR domain-containing glycosyltransferase [Paenibacillus glycanilyticus]MCM3628004.1 glycosyltransferase [Paenibacillus glycanilyticus]
MADQRKRISLCMIVKNEEKHLPGCLDSVQGIADEIIIVDTGSTDETVAIAERYGAVVIRSGWEHDFAKARNKGVERASGEWILFLDADEQLDETTKPQLLAFAGHAELSALLLQIRNQIGPDHDQGSTIHPVLRMFRNDPAHRFEGRIHEQISFSILRKNPSARFHLTDVVIHHYGYRTQVVAEKNKLKRNMELLELALAEEPGNTFHRYNIGVEYLRNNRAADALEAFRTARRSDGFEQLSYAHLVLKYESLSLQLLGRWEEAAAVAREGTAMFPDYTDLWHYIALCGASTGRYKAAMEAAEKALEMGAAPARYHTEDGMGTFRTAYLQGRIYEALLDEQGVVQAYITALRFKPSLLPPLFRLCKFMRTAGREGQLAALMARRIACPDEAAMLKLAGVMVASGCPDSAVSYLEWQAELYKEPALRSSLSSHAVALSEGDFSRLPFSGYRGKEEVEELLSPAAHWRERAEYYLERVQQQRKQTAEKQAIQSIRLLMPGFEGW